MEVEKDFPVGSKVFVLCAPFHGCQAKVVGDYLNSEVQINITHEQEPFFKNLKKKIDAVPTAFFDANNAASRLSISSLLFSKITGSIFVSVETDANKFNIGMNLKFNRRNEEVVGYTKKVDSVWMYSQKTIDLLGKYIQKFPELFNTLLSSDRAQDTYFKSEKIFPDPDTRKQKLEELKKWLGEIRALTKNKQTCGLMEQCKVAAVERYMEEFTKENDEHKQIVTLRVKSENLFKPGTEQDQAKTDCVSDTKVLDRIVCVRSSYEVPLGFKGTVVGITNSKLNDKTEIVYNIIFDKEFTNGISWGGLNQRGYNLCRTSFINLSLAIRNGFYKPLLVRKDTNQSIVSEKQKTLLSTWEILKSNGSAIQLKPQEEKITLVPNEAWRQQQTESDEAPQGTGGESALSRMTSRIEPRETSSDHAPSLETGREDAATQTSTAGLGTSGDHDAPSLGTGREDAATQTSTAGLGRSEGRRTIWKKTKQFFANVFTLRCCRRS